MLTEVFVITVDYRIESEECKAHLSYGVVLPANPGQRPGLASLQFTTNHAKNRTTLCAALSGVQRTYTREPNEDMAVNDTLVTAGSETTFGGPTGAINQVGCLAPTVS
jgi:hypothetical protein